jgi:acetoin utilization protein AcuB
VEQGPSQRAQDQPIANVDPETVKIEEAMAVDVYAVSPDTSLLDVVAAMADHEYGCAVVIDGPHVTGIFTTVDALRVLAGFAHVSDGLA